MRTFVLFCSAILCATLLSNNLYAQSDSQENPATVPEDKMPNLKPDIRSFNMPNLRGLKAFGTNSETGEPHYYIDPEAGLYFDLDEKKIRNFRNGEVYTFEELKKMLEAPAKKDPVPKKKTI